MLLDFDLMALTPYHFLTQLIAAGGLIFSTDSKAAATTPAAAVSLKEDGPPLSYSINGQNVQEGCGAAEKNITEQTLRKLKEYAYFFCNAATEYYEIIHKYQPSKVAVACVYLARQCCKLSSAWDVNLEEFSTYKESSLKDILASFRQHLGPVIDPHITKQRSNYFI